MNQNKPQAKESVVYWIILCFALGMGGMFYSCISILGMYLLLMRVRRDVGFELLIIASVLGGMAIVQVLEILILHPNMYNLDRILEPVVAAFFAIILLFTQKRWLAYCLIVYLVIIAVLLLWLALKVSRPQPQFAHAAISAVLVWLLVCWLRKQNPSDSDIRRV